MKLASLKNKTRDGQLIIVSRDLTRAVLVEDIAPTLQYALENWDRVFSQLNDRSLALNEKNLAGSFAFDVTKVTAPLPRAYQWADASAYVTHVELVRKSRGVEMPASFWTDPLMYQGGSDHFLGPCEDIPIQDLAWGVDFEAEVAVITDDVPMATPASQINPHIKLLMLVNDVSLRNLALNEVAKGFGFFQCKPPTAFSPVAITPDELGEAWSDSKVNLPILSFYNDKAFGSPNAATDMTFNFSTLVAHAARTRDLCAGTIIGSGTVSNRDHEKVGSSCIVERRMLETLAQGKPITPFMQYGDRVKIEMRDKENNSVFGAIDQGVVEYFKE